MIIDYFYPHGWDDVGYPSIYVRTRTEQGGLYTKIIAPDDEEYIPPHCWVASNTHPMKLSRVVARYPGVVIRDTITAEGNDGIPLMRLDTPNPQVLYDIKNELRTYEADTPYEDQIMFHMFPDVDKIPAFAPRIWYFDAEWQPNEPHEGATTMISVDDTHAEYPVIFAWKEEQVGHSIDFIDREGGYMLYMYENEDDMHSGFIKHLEECDPDMLIAHAMMWADLPQFMRRIKNPNRLSPINQVIKPRKNVGYRDTQQPILGRLCFDTALPWKTGSGLESVWQKSGKGQFRSRKLASIAEELKLTEEHGEQGAKMDADVRTWWVENFDEFVDYCVRDTTLLRKCTEKVSAIPFHIAMQKAHGVQFKSTHNVTNYLRGQFNRRTPLKGVTLFNRQREDLTAATVAPTIAGRHRGVACLDFASMYPAIITGANLCVTTKERHAGDNIRTVGNGTHWARDRKGILPSIVEDMMDLRKEYKKKMKNAETEEEAFQYDMLQTAVKVATNAMYGYVSQRKVGGGWIDADIGSTITYYGRQCIDTLLLESEKQGYRALAGHTDSGYIQVPFDETDALVEHLNNTIRNKLDLPNMDVEFEAYFDYWTTADVKNRNFGIITWPESKKGTLKVTGFGYKSSNASPLTKLVHGTIFNLVGTGAEEEEVNAAIRPISLKTLKGELSIDEVAPYGRIGKDKYVNVPPMSVRGAYYYNDHLDPIDPFRTGDSVRWVYVAGTPTGLPNTNVIGFRKPEEIDGFLVDHSLCVEKFIRAKIKRLYDVLEWNLDEASGAKRPKKHW
jgi:DNA polymerase elongation subunit (family B)